MVLVLTRLAKEVVYFYYGGRMLTSGFNPFLLTILMLLSRTKTNWLDGASQAFTEGSSTNRSGSPRSGLEGERPQRNKWRNKLFRFEVVWTLAAECEGVIANAWASAHHDFSHNMLNKKIHVTSRLLDQWNKTDFGNIRFKSKAVNDKIYALQKGEITKDTKLRVEKLKDSLEDMASKEQVMWQQRGKSLWLAAGDHNTSCFHAKANERRVRKEIRKIQDANGVEVCDREGVQKVVSHYFRSIFASTNPMPKAMDEVLANRIKPFLDTLISPSQAAFAPGRLITDNVLVAYELHHFLKHKNRGKKGFISLKLDVSKAYDRVEWRFLESVLLRLGFHAKFVSLIMTCVTMISFSFLLNSEQFGYLCSERGLRHGNLLSPYLFLLCAEAFSGMLRRAEEEGSIRGIAVSRLAPPISHLLFADDTLIFCEASIGAMTCIKKVLSSFERASGLQINLHKSALVISSNVAEEQRLELANIIGVDVVARHDKYLGLPTVAGRLKPELFEDIKTRIWRKIHSWSARKLSQAGRSVLIKVVLQTIPTYAMSCFHMPDQFLGELESLIANFFWQGENETKIHWVAWSKLCRTKAQGGIRWEVGNGRATPIMGHPWLPRPMTFQLIKHPATLSEDCKVAHLITQANEWNEPLILAEFYPEDAECILGIKLRCAGAPKVVLFAWRCAHDVLPTSQRLLQKGVIISEGCGSCRCLDDHEDVMDILFFCSFARLVWAISGLPWGSADSLS
ncbi:UNVERIFIED_CONTAM: putative mitochondrial protein [Sesamum latifolium]|uniref:Mitochondrial protein n=1 Tax=Sesamum latifolium TaxID=2727402 RepID=A0AAW2Y7I0_9LAMI